MMSGAVCFDAFGTLCKFAVRHRPYETLFARLCVNMHEATRLAMTTDTGLTELAAQFGKAHAAEGLGDRLETELSGISLFDEVAPSLPALAASGIQAWVISNLAAPYGAPLRRLLGDLVQGFSLSFEVGAVKPDAAIFAHACHGLSLPVSEVLMVGDSRKADVDGAEAFGMRAVWLQRGKVGEWPRSVSSLRQLTDVLNKRYI